MRRKSQAGRLGVFQLEFRPEIGVVGFGIVLVEEQLGVDLGVDCILFILRVFRQIRLNLRHDPLSVRRWMVLVMT